MKLLSAFCLALIGIITWSGQPPNTCDASSLSPYYYRLPTYSRYNRRLLSQYERSLARHKRIYDSRILGKFYRYHQVYYYHSRLVSYDVNVFQGASRDCGNFETNSIDDFLGFFSCPLPFEPSNFTYCCGSRDYSYCCSEKTREEKDGLLFSFYGLSSTTSIAIVVALVVFWIVIIPGIIACIICVVMRGRANRRSQIKQLSSDSSYPPNSRVIMNQPPPYSQKPTLPSPQTQSNSNYSSAQQPTASATDTQWIIPKNEGIHGETNPSPDPTPATRDLSTETEGGCTTEQPASSEATEQQQTAGGSDTIDQFDRNKQKRDSKAEPNPTADASASVEEKKTSGEEEEVPENSSERPSLKAKTSQLSASKDEGEKDLSSSASDRGNSTQRLARIQENAERSEGEERSKL